MRSVVVAPSTRGRPAPGRSSGANLKPCAAPRPTTHRLVPGHRDRARSRGRGSACTGSAPSAPGRPLPGQHLRAMWSASTVTASRGPARTVRSSRVDDRPAAVLGGLDRRLAVAGEAVEATGRPSRSTAAAGLAEVAAGPLGREVGDLLERHLQRHTDQPRPASTSLVHASAHTTSRRQRHAPSAVLTSTPSVAEVADRRHRRVLAQVGAVAAGLLLHHAGCRGRRARSPRPRWCSAGRALRQPELRPPCW